MWGPVAFRLTEIPLNTGRTLPCGCPASLGARRRLEGDEKKLSLCPFSTPSRATLPSFILHESEAMSIDDPESRIKIQSQDNVSREEVRALVMLTYTRLNRSRFIGL